MKEAEFDKFADEYRAVHASNIRVSGESPDFFAEYKVRDIARSVAATAQPLCHPMILDFGGGVGTSIPYFQKYFPEGHVVCLDVSNKSLAMAQNRVTNVASFVQFDGTTIPFADNSFDIGFAACVFHHIDEADHSALLSEIYRVLKPSGRLFVFEHNPFNPLTVQAVNTCPFDENARLISGKKMKRRFKDARFAALALRYRIFFPSVFGPLRPLERFLTGVPLGAQYYVVGCKS